MTDLREINGGSIAEERTLNQLCSYTKLHPPKQGRGMGAKERNCYMMHTHVGCDRTLSLSSWLVSRAQERYHVSLFFSFASLSYFSSVRLST